MGRLVDIETDKIDWDKLLTGKSSPEEMSGEGKKQAPKRRYIKRETLLPHSPIIAETQRLHLLNDEKTR
jgi:hypothetical protein